MHVSIGLGSNGVWVAMEVSPHRLYGGRYQSSRRIGVGVAWCHPEEIHMKKFEIPRPGEVDPLLLPLIIDRSQPNFIC